MPATPSTLMDIVPQQFDSRPAVIIPDGGPTLSYSQLRQQIHLLSSLLSSFLPSFTPDTAIALSLVNNVEFVASFIAITRMRGIAAPLNPSYTLDENKFYLDDMKCAALIVNRGQGEKARSAANDYHIPVLEISWDAGKASLVLTANGRPLQGQPISLSPQPSDVCLILHTSGTTSRPKAVPLTHRNICTSIRNISGTYDLSEKDSSLVVMPLFHVHGLIGVLLSTLATGGVCVIPPRFSASTFWPTFDHYKCTCQPPSHPLPSTPSLPDPPPHSDLFGSASSPLQGTPLCRRSTRSWSARSTPRTPSRPRPSSPVPTTASRGPAPPLSPPPPGSSSSRSTACPSWRPTP